MVGTHQLIENDTFDVASRLKAIDSTYFLVFNLQKRRFEVHSREQRGSSLCVVLPFDRLDERTLSHVRKTRSEARKQFLAEMEQENAKIEKAKLEKVAKKAEKETERIFASLK